MIFRAVQRVLNLLLNSATTEGKLTLLPITYFLLHCAAIFMEMKEDNDGTSSLIDQTNQYLREIHLLSWSELLDCLKQCQELLPAIKSSCMLREFLDYLVERLSWPYFSSPYASSPGSSCIQFSGDISIESTSNYSYQTTTWWYRDLDFLKTDLFERVVETMISHKLDNYVICSFLFHYQKLKFRSTLPAEKRKVAETVINLLYLLDRSLISRSVLFYILRCSLSLKMKRCYIKKLECLIAAILDQATLDDLLVPSPSGKRYAYDVNLILRFQKQFLCEGNKHLFMFRVKKVALLIDLYITEVAPDAHLKPSKFVKLATALPDLARDSHDMIYEAMDMYLEVHKNLCEEERIKLCCALNYDKLSASSLTRLAHNLNFPACAAVTAAASQHSKLRVLPKETGLTEMFNDFRSCERAYGSGANNGDDDQVMNMNKFDYQTIDNRFRGPRSIEIINRKKQTRAANIMQVSSIQAKLSP